MLEQGLSHLHDPTRSPDFTRAALLAEEGSVEYYGAPFVAKGRLVGVLEVFHWTRQETERLARAVGVSEAELTHIRRGALLDDIGKVGVPDSILFKPGPRSDEEWRVIRRHPQLVLEMLAPIAFLRPALDIPYCHHERWDGTGHPRGLKGDQIPRAARLFAVVDAWDALRSDRPYRAAWPEDRVLAHLRSLAGTYFDPDVVDLFLRLMREDRPAVTADCQDSFTALSTRWNRGHRSAVFRSAVRVFYGPLLSPSDNIPMPPTERSLGARHHVIALRGTALIGSRRRDDDLISNSLPILRTRDPLTGET